ncbi:hypothetical protein PFISCL1PPCAC_144, partial [Pristionchus fissidentatus]
FQLQNFWWRRFTGKERNPIVKKPKFSYEPMVMKDFQLVLLLLGVVYAFAALVFIVEILYQRYHQSAFKHRVTRTLFTTAAKISSLHGAKLPFAPR